MAQGVNIQFTSDHQKVMTGLQKQIAGLEKMVGTLKKVDRTGKKASKSVKGIGVAALGAVAGFVSLGLVVAKVNQALQEQVTLRRSATERIESQEENLKRLIQISGGSQTKFDAFLKTAADVVMQQGFTANQALGLMFQGGSLGFSNQQILEMAQFKKFAKDVGPLFEAIAGLQAAFGEQALGGTNRGAMNALLAAAEQSKVSVEVLAGQALTPAQAVKMKLGGTAAETLAALSVLAVSLKSPEEAATAIGRFADVVGRDKRFAGKGLIAAFETMEGLSPKARQSVIGENVRATRALALLENMDELRRVYAEGQRSVAATGPGDRVGQAIRLAESVPLLSGLTAKQRAREAASLAIENVEGPGQFRREAVRQVTKQVMAEFKVNAITRALVRADMAIREKFDAAPLTRYFSTLPADERNKERNAVMSRRFEELLEGLGFGVNPRTGELVPLTVETNVILRQILDKEPGVGLTGGPALGGPRMLPAPPGGPVEPLPPGAATGDADLGDVWAAANELMNRQGWSHVEKVRAFKAFRREHGFELDPSRQGTYLPNPSDLAGVDRQSLRDMVADLELVVDSLTQTLKKLNDSAENLTVSSEPLE